MDHGAPATRALSGGGHPCPLSKGAGSDERRLIQLSGYSWNLPDQRHAVKN